MSRQKIEQQFRKMRAEAQAFGAELLTKEDTFVDDDHLDCVWYGGYIGGLKYKGYELSLEVRGEVVIRGFINGEYFEYVNRLGNGAMNMAASDHLRTAFKSDAELDRAFEDGSIDYDDNNWIEAFVKEPDGYWSDGTVIDETSDVLDACSDISVWIKWLEKEFIAEGEK